MRKEMIWSGDVRFEARIRLWEEENDDMTGHKKTFGLVIVLAILGTLAACGSLFSVHHNCGTCTVHTFLFATGLNGVSSFEGFCELLVVSQRRSPRTVAGYGDRQPVRVPQLDARTIEFSH